MTEQGAPPGLESLRNIFRMENHDQALRVWRDAGLRERILVHLDAHDDLWWRADGASINIGNYLCPALKEGIVRQVFWVVPDQTWETPGALKPVRRRVKKVIQAYPGNRQPLQVGRGEIAATIWGKPWRVCTLHRLPALAETVLLDIDLDYLMTPRACGSTGLHGMLPWLWPADLVGRLKALGLQTDLVTIAYSVEGGYTPLKWKYLGDELAARLGHPSQDDASLQGMELMREAALAAHRGDRPAAEEKYLQARSRLPHHAAPDYHLAHLYADLGRPGDAQEAYQRALALDPAYRTPYNSSGIWYYSDCRYREAEREHRRTLALDPGDAYAHLGLAQLAAQRRQWQVAETWARQSLELDGQLIDSHRLLGQALAKQGRRREAIAAYEKSLELSLRGLKPLKGPILSHLEDHGLLDPDHFRIHLVLARLYELEGETDIAINGYRLGIAAGCDGFWPRSRLAHLYFQQRVWRNGVNEAGQAMAMIPGDLRRAGRRSWRRLRRALRAGYQALTAGG